MNKNNPEEYRWKKWKGSTTSLGTGPDADHYGDVNGEGKNIIHLSLSIF